MGQYGHFTLVWVSWYETNVFRELTGCQRDTPGFWGVTIQVDNVENSLKIKEPTINQTQL